MERPAAPRFPFWFSVKSAMTTIDSRLGAQSNGDAAMIDGAAPDPGSLQDHGDAMEQAIQPLMARLCDLTADVVFFPVRHHSPMCAALVSRLIDQLRPAAVLIEGPSDYNDSLDELRLDHQLPIAIYSYFKTGTSTSGAYYPFCEYSPEWSAVQAGTKSGAVVRFIDLPWSESPDDDRLIHRYADAEMRRGRYVQSLCDRMEVEDFDDLWDKLIESHNEMSVEDYLGRVHGLCFHIRLWEESIRVADRRREAWMVDQIQRTRERLNVDAAGDAAAGRILVVTGGFHSSALAARLEGFPCPGITLSQDESAATVPPRDAVGIALTTYSYERLDNLTGYNAGMPSPGFYEHVWRQRQNGERFTHQPLLVELVKQLRERRQTLNTADLIAVETTARALASLRGRDHVWRRDLIDAVTSALIKDELEYDCESPFIKAVQSILRGNRRGQLAAGTRKPPLVIDIHQQLNQSQLEFRRVAEQVEFDLLQPVDMTKSRLLHRLLLLDIRGITYAGGTDFLKREDLTRPQETWTLQWSPEFESSCIEASRYGTSLDDAVTSRLDELTRQQTRNASVAASLLVKSAQCGIDTLSATLMADMEDLIEQEPGFCESTEALGHLLFLFSFDEAFGTIGRSDIGRLVQLSFERSIWLLESLGQTTQNDKKTLAGLSALLTVFQRTSRRLMIEPAEFIAVLDRVERDLQKPPQVRGAAAGILWTLEAASSERVLADLMSFAQPHELGDFLAGLFALSREVAQRQPKLVETIDRMLLEFSADQFQLALPSLRLAFTYFTPREKHYMLTTLFEFLGIRQAPLLANITVDDATAAAALAVDERVFEAIRKYGLD